MAKPNFSLNTNFKVCARIKPLEYTSRMLEVANDSVVTIRDISNKTNSEKQQFHFNKVFDQSSKQDSVFNYIAENAINKALEGTNSCILSYGQTGAGKSYTMFGDDDKPSPGTINLYSDSKKDKKGIIAKTVEHLLKKNNDMEGVRELVLTCNFIEIYLDQVRDLGRNYSDRNIGSSNQKRTVGSITNTNPYETENLEIYEHANGQVLVRNAKSATIKSVDEVQELLATGFAVREKSGGKESQIWARSHTIFTINIVQKEIENEDLPFPKSMIQFVDLAGSERIAKSITEGQNKFQEAVLIMSHLTSLYKVLAAIATNSKNIPYRDSKLTKILYNCLTPYNNIIMIAHLHPAESNFEETLNTLQFVERCKNVDLKDKRGLGGNASGLEDSNYAAASNPSNDKLWKKMTDEIADLKAKIENIQKEHRGKLDKIQAYLGLENVDLDKISSNTLSKEAQALTVMKNTNMENQNLKATIMQTEETFEMMRKEFEDERREFFHKQSKLESNNMEIRELMKKNTDKLITTRNKDEDDLKKQIQILTEENKKLSGHNTQLLEEKTQALMNFSSNLDLKTRTLNQTMDMKSIGKKEAELEYKDEVTLLKSDYRKVAESLKQQYEHWLKMKNEEMDRYVEKAQDYQRKKKEQIEAMRIELMELYGVVQKQEKIIEKVENGGYSGGLRSFFIPSKDKPIAPTRHKYPQLYKFLDDKKPDLTTQTFFRIRDTTDFYPPYERTALSPPSRTMSKFEATMQNTGFSSISKSADKARVTRPDEVDLNLNINKLHVEDLRRYTDSLKQLCRRLKDSEKELKVQADKYVELNVYGDIHDIIREKDRYKELYKDQTRKNHDNKIMLESQGRLLKSNSKTQTFSRTRPGTSGWE